MSEARLKRHRTISQHEYSLEEVTVMKFATLQIQSVIAEKVKNRHSQNWSTKLSLLQGIGSLLLGDVALLFLLLGVGGVLFLVISADHC